MDSGRLAVSMKGNRPLEMAERALNGKFHARGLGCLSAWRWVQDRRMGRIRTPWSRGYDLERGGDCMGAHEPSLAGVPARTEILDIHRIFDFESRKKLPSALADAPLQQWGLVSGFADASGVANSLRFFKDRPTAE